jgi:hypothetical protein
MGTHGDEFRMNLKVGVNEKGRDTPKDTPARSKLDMHFRTTAERVAVEWLKERMERRKWGEDAPPIPTHLR